MPLPSLSVSSRKANYTLQECRFIIDKFREHKDFFDYFWTNGPRLEKTEVWDDIFEKYDRQFPNTGRTATDIRRKVIKLRSEARRIYERERLRAQGEDVASIVSKQTMQLSITPAHRMMIKAMLSDVNIEEGEADFIEYEVELDNPEGDGNNDEEMDDGDDGVQTAGGDDDVDPERIIKQLFLPEEEATTSNYNNTPPAKQTATRKPPRKRRKGAKVVPNETPMKKTAREIMDLQKQKLEFERDKLMIECDNLLLMQKKLELEVRLAERQLMQHEGGTVTGQPVTRSRVTRAGAKAGPKTRSAEKGGSGAGNMGIVRAVVVENGDCDENTGNDEMTESEENVREGEAMVDAEDVVEEETVTEHETE